MTAPKKKSTKHYLAIFTAHMIAIIFHLQGGCELSLGSINATKIGVSYIL